MKLTMKKYLVTALLCGAVLLTSSCGKADSAYKSAVKSMDEGKYEESIESFKSAIKENPEKAEYYIGYGMVLNYEGKYEEAIKEFEKAVQDVENKISKENNKKLYYGEAIAYYGLNDYEKTISLCDDAVKIDHVKELNYDIKLLKAAALQISGDDKGAADLYTEIIKDDKKNTEAYLRRGDIYCKTGDYDAAYNDYNDAVKADKKCYDAYFGLYRAYKSQGDESSANKALENIISLDSDDGDVLMQQGKAYYYMSDYDNASSKLELAVKKGNQEALYYQGMIKMGEKDYYGAVDLFKMYLRDNTSLDIPEVYNQIAGCYIETGDYKEAQNYINEGLSLGNTSAVQMLRKNQVILYEKSGSYKKAAKEAKEYIKSYPADKGMKKELNFIRTRITAKNNTKKGN